MGQVLRRGGEQAEAEVNPLNAEVSTEARPILLGKPCQPVEFGCKLGLVETLEGLIPHFHVQAGNPSDGGLLIGLVACPLFGDRVPRSIW
ncbi:MAG: hypothetical protein AB1609_12105 [Bacillota bacterium]